MADTLSVGIEEMKINPEKNVRLSSKPVMFEIDRLADEAHTEAFQDIFVAVVAANRDLFSEDGEIVIQTRHPFLSELPFARTVATGKKSFSTTVRLADFLADLRQTALFLYLSNNDSMDLFWNLNGKPLHMVMAFDNPYFVMKD